MTLQPFEPAAGRWYLQRNGHPAYVAAIVPREWIAATAWSVPAGHSVPTWQPEQMIGWADGGICSWAFPSGQLWEDESDRDGNDLWLLLPETWRPGQPLPELPEEPDEYDPADYF